MGSIIGNVHQVQETLCTSDSGQIQIIINTSVEPDDPTKLVHRIERKETKIHNYLQKSMLDVDNTFSLLPLSLTNNRKPQIPTSNEHKAFLDMVEEYKDFKWFDFKLFEADEYPVEIVFQRFVNTFHSIKYLRAGSYKSQDQSKIKGFYGHLSPIKLFSTSADDHRGKKDNEDSFIRYDDTLRSIQRDEFQYINKKLYELAANSLKRNNSNNINNGDDCNYNDDNSNTNSTTSTNDNNNTTTTNDNNNPNICNNNVNNGTLEELFNALERFQQNILTPDCSSMDGYIDNILLQTAGEAGIMKLVALLAWGALRYLFAELLTYYYLLVLTPSTQETTLSKCKVPSTFPCMEDIVPLSPLEHAARYCIPKEFELNQLFNKIMNMDEYKTLGKGVLNYGENSFAEDLIFSNGIHVTTLIPNVNIDIKAQISVKTTLFIRNPRELINNGAGNEIYGLTRMSYENPHYFTKREFGNGKNQRKAALGKRLNSPLPIKEGQILHVDQKSVNTGNDNKSYLVVNPKELLEIWKQSYCYFDKRGIIPHVFDGF